MNKPDFPAPPKANRRLAIVSALAASGWRNLADAQALPPPSGGNGPPANTNGMRIVPVNPVCNGPSEYLFDNLESGKYWVFATGDGVTLSHPKPPKIVYWGLDGNGQWVYMTEGNVYPFLTAYLLKPSQSIHLTWPFSIPVDFTIRPIDHGH